MLQNDALATAAHLHVLLRRKTGRVTDTEWMAGNAEYAQAIVRFAREKARDDGHTELLPLADRLESLVLPTRKAVATPSPVPPPPAAPPLSAANDVSARYVGRLR
jgi:hypothetical protein